MPDSLNHPQPFGSEIDLLNDAAWDLRDYGEAFIHDTTDSEKWSWWLRRYEGFAENEFEIQTLANVLYITLKD